MGLTVIETAAAMQRWSDEHRRAGRVVGCVPTMGYLHEGHLALIRECKKRADKVVMTLFVNPAQFAPHEDFNRYPRDFAGDCEKAAGAGADAVYAPTAAAMYPEGYQTYVTVEEVSAELEGELRPTHFRGVATVVLKLFAAARPGVAVFGEKDFQQLKVIERMTRDLDLGIEIVGHPIVREPDGLAMSSRNVYLSAGERQQALAISQSLFAAQTAAAKGKTSIERRVEDAVKTIAGAGLVIDYVTIRDEQTLAPLDQLDRAARMLIAVKAGKTRLIDNLKIQPFGA
jgi:pantoate--beta-alanine ligase